MYNILNVTNQRSSVNDWVRCLSVVEECHRNLLATVNHRSSSNHTEANWDRLRVKFPVHHHCSLHGILLLWNDTTLIILSQAI